MKVTRYACLASRALSLVQGKHGSLNLNPWLRSERSAPVLFQFRSG